MVPSGDGICVSGVDPPINPLSTPCHFGGFHKLLSQSDGPIIPHMAPHEHGRMSST